MRSDRKATLWPWIIRRCRTGAGKQAERIGLAAPRRGREAPGRGLFPGEASGGLVVVGFGGGRLRRHLGVDLFLKRQGFGIVGHVGLVAVHLDFGAAVLAQAEHGFGPLEIAFIAVGGQFLGAGVALVGGFPVAEEGVENGEFSCGRKIIIHNDAISLHFPGIIQ